MPQLEKTELGKKKTKEEQQYFIGHKYRAKKHNTHHENID